MLCSVNAFLKHTRKLFALIIFQTICHFTSICQKLNDSVVVDNDGNKYSIQLFGDGNLWMTTNLNVRIPDSYCYDNKEENCNQYGRLYTFQSAKEGCALLGDGWRLPTAEDWYRLAVSYSPGSRDSITVRKNGYQVLLVKGSSLFNAMLGGGRDQVGNYARINAHGFYWTASETDTGTACFANFAKGSQALFIQPEGEKERAFSVRCVKSVGH